LRAAAPASLPQVMMKLVGVGVGGAGRATAAAPLHLTLTCNTFFAVIIC